MLSPLSAKLSWLFLLTGCLKALSTLTYTCTCKEQWISGQDDFSMCQHEKSCRTDIDKNEIFL